jgi:Mycothiol maleylpyruvate isomerase N-terminal domain
MDMLGALSHSFDHATKVMAGVGADQLDAPTPCSEWDVQALVAHIMGVLVNMCRGATGQDGDLPDDLAATVLGVGQGFVTEQIRAFAGFDPPVPVASDASPTDQLVAFLGRQP